MKEKNKMSSIKNIIIISSIISNKMEVVRIPAISQSMDPLALEIRASGRTAPDALNSELSGI